MDQQRRLRVGAFHGEQPVVVLGERIGAIDAHSRSASAHTARRESGILPSRGRSRSPFTFFGLDLLAVREERHLAGGVGRIEAGDRGHGSDLLRVEDTARRFDVFDGKLRLRHARSPARVSGHAPPLQRRNVSLRNLHAHPLLRRTCRFCIRRSGRACFRRAALHSELFSQ